MQRCVGQNAELLDAILDSFDPVDDRPIPSHLADARRAARDWATISGGTITHEDAGKVRDHAQRMHKTSYFDFAQRGCVLVPRGRSARGERVMHTRGCLPPRRGRASCPRRCTTCLRTFTVIGPWRELRSARSRTAPSWPKCAACSDPTAAPPPPTSRRPSCARDAVWVSACACRCQY